MGCATGGANPGVGVPRMSVSEREELYAGWRKAVRRTLDWVEPSG